MDANANFRSEKRWCCITLAVMWAITCLEYIQDSLDVLQLFGVFQSTWMVVGAWHMYRCYERNQKSNPLDIFIWIRHYIPIVRK